jgi:hypothetical protein
VPVGFLRLDLPVQAPTKYKLAIAMQTAKALRPPSQLARRDEVIAHLENSARPSQSNSGGYIYFGDYERD